MNKQKFPFFIDTHAHLADESFAKDLEGIIRRAREAGVQNIVVVAETASQWARASEIRRLYPPMHLVLGIHPHEADRYGSDVLLDRLKTLMNDAAALYKPAGIGETGLDYYKRLSDPLNQRKLFLTHINKAHELSLPIVIHCRQAYADSYPYPRRQ